MEEVFKNYDIEKEMNEIPKFQGEVGEWIKEIVKGHFQYFNAEME